MVQPYDYTLNVQNPSEVFTNSLWNGYKLGATMDQVKQQREQAALKQQQEQQRAEDTRSLIQNPSNENFTSFQLMYPDQAETIQKVWQQKSQGDKDLSWRIGSEALAALKSDSPDIAKDVFNNAAIAYENSGKKQDAGSMRFYANLIDKNPANAKNLMQDYLSTVDRERFDKTFVPLNEQNRANEMQPYEIAKTQAETGRIKAETQGQTIENQYKPQQLQSGINQTQSQTALNYANIQNLADRLRLDQDKLQSDVELKYMELNPSNIKLSDGAQKIVNDNMVESVGLEQSANKMDDLANRFEKESQAGGLYTKGWAGFKRITGWSNDDQNAMIREYSRLRNSEAIKSLPPGPATDRDIELALRGLPPETADSTTLTSFLRGYAKLNRMDSAYKQMQAEWVNQVGNMGSNKRDVEVLGIKVPAGTTFSGYASKNLDKTLKRQADQAIDRQIATGQRSYMSAVQ